jgi:hypothetical protein
MKEGEFAIGVDGNNATVLHLAVDRRLVLGTGTHARTHTQNLARANSVDGPHVEVTDDPATEMSSIGVLKPASRINFRTNPEASQPEA